MSEAWDRGGRDGSGLTPRQGGEDRWPGNGRRRRAERNILVGVSHPSNDPARHRVFEVRAGFDAAAGGWVAQAAEQDANEQRSAWVPVPGGADAPVAFPTAAACLGDAVAKLVATVDQDAGG